MSKDATGLLEAIISKCNIDQRHLRKVMGFYETAISLIAEKSTILDVCCGNGLLGFYIAIRHPDIEIIQFDILKTKKYSKLRKSLENFFILDKCKFILSDIRKGIDHKLGPDSTFLSIHACSDLTDAVIYQAIRYNADFAVMPCCQNKHEDLQFKETERSNFIRRNNYSIQKDYIKKEITDKNLVILGTYNPHDN